MVDMAWVTRISLIWVTHNQIIMKKLCSKKRIFDYNSVILNKIN